MIEFLITISLMLTFQINIGNSIRLVDILLVIFFIWGIFRHKKITLDKNILIIVFLRIFYICLSLIILGKFNLSTFLSMGYFIEFIFVYFIIFTYKDNLEFLKLWKILSYLLVFNTLIAIVQFVIFHGTIRSQGIIGSTATCFFLPIIIYGLFLDKKSLKKFKFFILSILGIVGAILSEQRLMIVIIFLNIIVFLVLNGKLSFKYIPRIFVGVLLGAVLGYFFIPESLKIFYANKILEIFSSISVDNNSSMYTRYVLWESAFNMFKYSPIIGIGSGMFARQGLEGLSRYTDRVITERVIGLSTHNNFLEYLSELGLLGTAITYLLVTMLYKNIVRERLTIDIENNYLFKILKSSFITLCIYDLIGQSTFLYFWSFNILLIYSYIFSVRKNNSEIMVSSL